MKRLFALLLSVVFLFAGCSAVENSTASGVESSAGESASSAESSSQPSTSGGDSSEEAEPVSESAALASEITPNLTIDCETASLRVRELVSLTMENADGERTQQNGRNLTETPVMTAECQAIYDKYIAGSTTPSGFPHMMSFDEKMLPSEIWFSEIFDMCWMMSHNGQLYAESDQWDGYTVDAETVELTIQRYFDWTSEQLHQMANSDLSGVQQYNAKKQEYTLTVRSGTARTLYVTGFREDGDLLLIDVLGCIQQDLQSVGVAHTNTITVRLEKDGSFRYVANNVDNTRAVNRNFVSADNLASVSELKTDEEGITTFLIVRDGSWTRCTMQGYAGQMAFLSNSRLLVSSAEGLFDCDLVNRTSRQLTEVGALDSETHRLLGLLVDAENGRILLLHVEDFLWDEFIEDPYGQSSEAPTMQVTMYDSDWNLLGCWDTGLTPLFEKVEYIGWIPASPSFAFVEDGIVSVCNKPDGTHEGTVSDQESLLHYLEGRMETAESR